MPLYRNLGVALRRSTPLAREARGKSRPLIAAIRRKLLYSSGRGMIVGQTLADGLPVGSRRVRLFEQRAARLIAETWSDTSGNYRFAQIDPALEYFVTAHDHTLAYDAVIHEHIVPEVMP